MSYYETRPDNGGFGPSVIEDPPKVVVKIEVERLLYEENDDDDLRRDDADERHEAELAGGHHRSFLDGWCIKVRPWLVPVHGRDRQAIVWKCDYPIAIRFETPSHFYNAHPFSVGGKLRERADDAGVPHLEDEATSGPVKLGAPRDRGPFNYTIDIFPEANTVLTIDPQYLIERQDP